MLESLASHGVESGAAMVIYTAMKIAGLWRTSAVMVVLAVLWNASAAGVSAQGMSDEQRVGVARKLKANTVTVVLSGSSGSGFVVAGEGVIVTNAHVASGAGLGGRVELRLGDGARQAGRVVAFDPAHDLAVIAPLEGLNIAGLALGDSDAVEVGQTVLAFGSPFGLEGTLTQGIVSARRDLAAVGGQMRGVIQTDAPINPGNSGGPLVNRRGEVIGVNTAIMSRSGGSNGIGFAVPASYVKALLAQVRERLTATQPSASATEREASEGPPRRHGRAAPVWLGLFGDDFEYDGYAGVRVRKVIPGGPAAQAGLLGQGDPPPNFARQLGIPWTGHIILALDGRPVRNLRQLKEMLRGMEEGQRVVVTVTVGPGVVTGETTLMLTRQP